MIQVVMNNDTGSIDTGSAELMKKLSPENCSWKQDKCQGRLIFIAFLYAIMYLFSCCVDFT